jgi:hypothetical protein
MTMTLGIGIGIGIGIDTARTGRRLPTGVVYPDRARRRQKGGGSSAGSGSPLAMRMARSTVFAAVRSRLVSRRRRVWSGLLALGGPGLPSVGAQSALLPGPIVAGLLVPMVPGPLVPPGRVGSLRPLPGLVSGVGHASRASPFIRWLMR